MGANTLRGSLPSSISSLSQLRKVHICCNDLTGRIPFLGGMEHITFFSLWGNQLTGNLSSLGLENLKKITTLFLSCNKLSGTIPEYLHLMRNLQSFWLKWNDISGTIPFSIGNMTRLNEIIFSNNRISGSIPESLGELKVLQSLDLARNYLTGTVPRALGGLEQLNLLDMAHNNINGSVNFLCVNKTIVDFKMDCESKVQCDCCSDCV